MTNTTNTKRYIFSCKDQHITEVSEDLWHNLIVRSDMDRYTVEASLMPSDGLYCKLWINDKVYDVESFDGLVETLVRNLFMNLACAKDFSHRINSAAANNTKILLGRF